MVSGVSAATVSCGIEQYFDNPAVKFGELCYVFDVDSSAESDRLGLTATVFWNGDR